MAEPDRVGALSTPRTRTVFLERFPLRKVIQGTLAVVLVLGVGYGAWKTLSLPAGEAISGAGWRDFVVQGLSRGSIYAMIAIGYSLVYGILLMINFAHGEVFMAGAFASFFVARTFEESGFLNSNAIAAILVLMAVAMAVSMLIAVLLERVAYRPLRGAPRLVPLITAIGASLFLQNAFRGFFSPRTRGYPTPEVLSGQWNILGIQVDRPAALVILTAALSMVALSLFVARTKTGKSMRAVSEDKEIASLMGINVDHVIVTTFAVGGLLAGVAGVLFAFTFGQVGPFMGFVPGIKAFTAAVLGGIGSISGAALGGLTLGLMEAVAPPLLLKGVGVPSFFQLQDVVAFMVLVFVLIFRPGGILGTAEEQKV
ncbi:MAG: branched-chain amino acid ABC transporter permease [Actinomycetota bacterium]